MPRLHHAPEHYLGQILDCLHIPSVEDSERAELIGIVRAAMENAKSLVPPLAADDPEVYCLCGHKRSRHGVYQRSKTATCYECECETFRVNLMAALSSALAPKEKK